MYVHILPGAAGGKLTVTAIGGKTRARDAQKFLENIFHLSLLKLEQFP